MDFTFSSDFEAHRVEIYPTDGDERPLKVSELDDVYGATHFYFPDTSAPIDRRGPRDCRKFLQIDTRSF